MPQTFIRQLRPYTTSDGKKDIKDIPYLDLHCKGINYLFSEEGFNNLKKHINERDGYNLYYTVCEIESREMTTKDGKKYTNKRAFVSQDVIPFDIDHIFQERWEDYIPRVEQILGIPRTDMIVVRSGNGLQFIVKSAEEWKDIRYFSEHTQSYKNLCKKIEASLEADGLVIQIAPGVKTHVDTKVWGPARLMRLPETLNRKPTNDPFAKDARVTEALLTPWREMKGKGLKLDKDTALTKNEAVKTEREFQRPDVDTICSECGFMKGCLDGSIDVHEPECYAFLGIAAFLEDEDKTAWKGLNKFTSPTIDRMNKDAKIQQAREKSNPRTCSDISTYWDGCEKCKYWGHIKSPIALRSQTFSIDLAYNGELGAKPKEMEVISFIFNKLGIKFDSRLGRVDWENSDYLKEGEDNDPFRKDYFRWNGKYWELLKQSTLQRIWELINLTYGYRETTSKVDATFKGLLKLIPQNPKEDLHLSKHNRANFQNGTLHAVHTEDGNLTLDFKPHNKRDHLTYILPGNYTDDYTDRNQEFEEMLHRIWEGDPDRDQKIQALQELYGACLMPMFPRIAFFIGKTGGGKSTVLKILSYLIGIDNISGVPLTGKDFDLANMIGKNVNMVLDIDDKTPIREDILKQVEDRFPVNIKRKFKTDLRLPLPPIQLFGANTLPPNFEKTGALKRRITILLWLKSLTEGEEDLDPTKRKSKKEYASWCYNLNPQGVLNFAIEGLYKLVVQSHGHYTNPDSGKAQLNKWQYENDTIKQFLDDIEEGKVSTLKINKDDSNTTISRFALYSAFYAWLEDQPGYVKGKIYIGRNKFYDAVSGHGYQLKKTNNDRLFLGISEAKTAF